MATRPVSALPTPESQQASNPKSVKATLNPPQRQDKVTISEAARAEQAQVANVLPKGGQTAGKS
jgi:hypothetical protein